MVVTYSRSPRQRHPPGAAVIQLRHKKASKATITSEAKSIAKICRDNDTIFIVNDHPDIAVEVGADGVHVGQGDQSIADCREILQPDQIVGKSNAAPQRSDHCV